MTFIIDTYVTVFYNNIISEVYYYNIGQSSRVEYGNSNDLPRRLLKLLTWVFFYLLIWQLFKSK